MLPTFQRETVESVSHLRIDPSKIKIKQDSKMMSGGFGDVRQGKLRQGLFGGPSVLVAVKTLRTAGDQSQRLRVAIVSGFAREFFEGRHALTFFDRLWLVSSGSGPIWTTLTYRRFWDSISRISLTRRGLSPLGYLKEICMNGPPRPNPTSTRGSLW